MRAFTVIWTPESLAGFPHLNSCLGNTFSAIGLTSSHPTFGQLEDKIKTHCKLFADAKIELWSFQGIFYQWNVVLSYFLRSAEGYTIQSCNLEIKDFFYIKLQTYSLF